jgi:hypothetical protein
MAEAIGKQHVLGFDPGMATGFVEHARTRFQEHFLAANRNST